METMRDRLSGRTMVERTRASGVRAALNPQEMIAVAGLVIIGLTLIWPQGMHAGIDAGLIGHHTIWGIVALLLAAPQAAGLVLARLGFIEVPMAHTARMTMLLTSFAVTLMAAYAFTAAEFIWMGGGHSLLTSIAFASASRHVHLNNGRTRKSPYLDAEVSKALMRGGYRV